MTAAACAHCQQPRPAEFTMKVKNGEELVMVWCSRCERRSWYADGRPIEREEMLSLTNGDADFVVTPSQRSIRSTPRH